MFKSKDIVLYYNEFPVYKDSLFLTSSIGLTVATDSS